MINVIEYLADVGAELKFTHGENDSLNIMARRVVDGVPLECFVQIDNGLLNLSTDHDGFILRELVHYLEAMAEQAQKGPPADVAE